MLLHLGLYYIQAFSIQLSDGNKGKNGRTVRFMQESCPDEADPPMLKTAKAAGGEILNK